MAQPDVLIIGGGVIGASIAFHLAEQGTRVTLLERGRAGGHASLASAGLLHPTHRVGVSVAMRALSTASFALYPDLVARLREISGVDAQYLAHGWLMTAGREDELAALEADVRATDAAYELRVISGREARELEPELSPTVAAAILAPHGAHVYVPSLLQAYTQAAARLGATVRRGVEAAELCVEGTRVTGARTADGETIAAGQTIVAGGAWTPRLAGKLGLALPVYPMRGQILALQAIPAPFRRVLFGDTIYLAPKADGSVVAGATYEEAGFDDRLTAAGVNWLLRAALELVPALAGATFRQAWVGLRPASRDGLPLLGPAPGWEGLSVATGHTAEGVLLSPISGKLMAQLVRGEPTDLPLAPFSLARFPA